MKSIEPTIYNFPFAQGLTPTPCAKFSILLYRSIEFFVCQHIIFVGIHLLVRPEIPIVSMISMQPWK